MIVQCAGYPLKRHVQRYLSHAIMMWPFILQLRHKRFQYCVIRMQRGYIVQLCSELEMIMPVLNESIF